MLKLIDVALSEAAVLMPERDLRQIIAESEYYETLFFGLLRTCLLALKHTRNPAIEEWIKDKYVELRHEMPDDLKQLYLKNIAFRGQ